MDSISRFSPRAIFNILKLPFFHDWADSIEPGLPIVYLPFIEMFLNGIVRPHAVLRHLKRKRAIKHQENNARSRFVCPLDPSVLRGIAEGTPKRQFDLLSVG